MILFLFCSKCFIIVISFCIFEMVMSYLEIYIGIFLVWNVFKVKNLEVNFWNLLLIIALKLFMYVF